MALYLKMNNTELAHSLMQHHNSKCDCLSGPEEKRCAYWNLVDEIVGRLTQEPREKFFPTSAQQHGIGPNRT
jgi:hypothetical protein